MHKVDLNKIVFYSKDDLSSTSQLQKSEKILRDSIKSDLTEINEILEFYNIKKYLDNNIYLKNWSESDLKSFKKKALEYGNIVGKFISNINDGNILNLYSEVLQCYINSFWELINDQKSFKNISKLIFAKILSDEPHLIYTILIQKNIVHQYNIELKNFLLAYSKSAEIVLSIYGVESDFRKKKNYLPASLTTIDKENIIANYIDSKNVNLNYMEIIQNVRNTKEFIISDKLRLKAKRLQKIQTEKLFADNAGFKYGVAISFTENINLIKDFYFDDENILHLSYSSDFIKKNNTPNLLLQNFIFLFEYLDEQNRINLVSKRSQFMGLERLMGLNSKNQYIIGTSFPFSEMTAEGQIVGYSKILNEMNSSIENILQFAFTKSFHKKYNFAENARFSIPSSSTSYFEKVRFLAPEFESLLKQYKLFVEDGFIDFELLQISSTPSSIKNIPSIRKNKYFYFNEKNSEMVSCSNLFFSDQTLLTYVEPFKDKNYKNFFEIISNEDVNFYNYGDYERSAINFLIEKRLVEIDSKDNVKILNINRILIMKDLYENEVASMNKYSTSFQDEAVKMENEKIIFFENTLLSKPEQSYFNYFLNKSEFTNGLDLRNSYLHGTQANPDEIQKHESAYFNYLKLLVLIILKIDDDLNHNGNI